ncbi:MAG TPA: hypothetical protein VEU30_01110 [Thermoanaerobaculia bacterium]|nr:hypothetical protein [Thermoanaerobaculia bacterium]
MQKILTRSLVLSAAILAALQLLADYTVVLKDGTRYKARQKYTIVNGKAIINLTNGQSMQVDPALIDVAKSEQITKLGVNANIVDLSTNMPQNPGANRTQQPSLGEQVRLRNNAKSKAPAPVEAAPVAPAPVAAGGPPQRVLENFDKAYDNLGIFEKDIIPTGPRSLRAELTVDTEERVFNAISATSYLIMRNAGVDGAQIDMVELFMKTTTGGSAGRFQMSRSDADALDKKLVSQQDYFVRKVIY